jgi:hypothetical protein
MRARLGFLGADALKNLSDVGPRFRPAPVNSEKRLQRRQRHRQRAPTFRRA